MNDPRPPKQQPVDVAVGAILLAFAAAVSLFAIRNNDVWWMLSVGRYMVETRSFITADPFTFTLSGEPWSPQSWLAAIVFYLVHGAAGPTGLVVLRALLVVATTALLLRALSRSGVSWASAGVLVVLLLLVANTRFIVRAHLFEYVFLAALMSFLLTAHRRRGRAFFVTPAVLQLLWTNMHPSYPLGPALALLFFGGEWLSERASTRVGWIRPLHRHDYRRAFSLVLVLAAICLANPEPTRVLTEFAGGQQRELMSRFTLEWKSPFDPAIAGGNFHPYYEILLALSGATLLLVVRRLPLAAVGMLAATAYLSLQSHRFRVEFALVAVVMIAVLLRDVTWVRAIAVRVGASRARTGLAAVTVVLVAVTAPGRVEIRPGVSGRYPDATLEFIVDHDVAHRPFNTIGFGSYMTWKLYGQRLHFIDGRNFDSGLYRNFLLAQSNRDGLEQVIAGYRLDSFLIPPVHRSDAGMRNIHGWLRELGGWSLVHVSDDAFLYVNDASVSAAFLGEWAYRHYHPLALGGRMNQAQIDGIIADLERAVSTSPESAQLWLELGMVQGARGNVTRALEAVERCLALDPENRNALGLRGQLQSAPNR